MSERKLDDVDIGMLALFIVLLPFGVAWRGYALSVLWGWFIAPAFDMRPLGIAQAVGLILFVTFFTSSLVIERDNDKPIKERARTAIFKMAVMPAITIGLAWPVTWVLS